METRKLNIVRFAPKGEDSFYDAVTSRVALYFETRKLSPYANTEMWVKTVVMLLLYFVPYLFIVTGQAADSLWLFFGVMVFNGLGNERYRNCCYA